MGEGANEAWACDFVADWHDRQARLYRQIADNEPRIDAANRKRANDVSVHHAGSAAALRNRSANIRRALLATHPTKEADRG